MSWYNTCYARLLIDNHITDHRPEYMSRFSPEEYARLVKLSGTEASMVYACDHNGNCYYPTKIGHQHANLHGRDIFGETTRLLRQNGVTPIAYYTVTFHNDCARRLPHTAARSCTGITHSGRYHFTCPNQPDALAFYQAELAEIIAYEIDGLFIDMTFWPLVCTCDECQKKFGREIPETIDFRNPEWVAFQRFRENSMAQFAQKLTDFVKTTRPTLSVTHQFSPVLHGWFLGQSTGIAKASDYASGDFYGSKLQQRFGTKVFDAFTSNPPFEFMTSRCVTLYDHTSTKSDDELYLSALTTLANGGAYFFIDAINPDGTLHQPFYHRLARLNQRLEPYRRAIASTQARLTAEVGIYFSLECCVNHDLDGKPLSTLDTESANNMSVRKNAVCEEAMGTADLLSKLHIPYRIITDRQEDWSSLKALFVNQAAFLNAQECAKMRKFAQAGGTLIVTGETSLYTVDGHTDGDFALADVLGIHFSGKFSPEVTYTDETLVSCVGSVPLVTSEDDTTVLAFLRFPDFPVGDEENYSSIHSNPPGLKSSPYPAITKHPIGNGKCIWFASPLLRVRQYSQQEFLQTTLAPFLPRLVVETNLPASAEVTLLKTETEEEHLLCIVNLQDEFPPIPLYHIFMKLHLPLTPEIICQATTGQEVPFQYSEGITSLFLNNIQEAEFLKIKFKTL